MCKLHPSTNAKYYCSQCGFICIKEEEKYTNHSVHSIIDKFQFIYLTTFQQQVLIQKIRLTREAKTGLLKYIESYLLQVINHFKAITRKTTSQNKIGKTIKSIFTTKCCSGSKLICIIKKTFTRILLLFKQWMTTYLEKQCYLKMPSTTPKYYSSEERKSLVSKANQLIINANDSNNNKIAIPFYKEALNISMDLFGKNHNQCAKLLKEIGTQYFELKDYVNSAKYSNDALLIYKQQNLIDHDVADLYNHIGILYNESKSKAQAIVNYNESIKIYVNLYGQNNVYVAGAYFNIGNAYNDLCDFTSAINYYNKALLIFNKLSGNENDNTKIDIYCKLGYYSILQKDFSKPIYNYNEARQIAINMYGKNTVKVADICNNLCAAYNAIGDQKSAINVNDNVIKIYINEIGKNTIQVADAYANIGDAYLQANDYENGVSNLKESLQIRSY